jgi:SAM-dependent methyltransferase
MGSLDITAGARASRSQCLTRAYAKTCSLRDFGDPELAPLITDIAPHLSAERPHRKGWEHAMAALFLRDTGRLTSATEVLDVGAGAEPMLFWLAQQVGRVVAVDMYGRGRFATREARRSFFDDPGAFAPYPAPVDRIEVHDMDARDLAFADSSFDAVVSLSAIEHFGSRSDIARAAREIGRVLRPGGHAFLVTELLMNAQVVDRWLSPSLCRIRRRLRISGDVLTLAELDRLLIGPSRLSLMQPIDTTMRREDLANVQRLRLRGTPLAKGDPYPHIVLRCAGSLFTSVALPLVKPC